MQKDFTRKVPVALENLLNGAFASSGSIRIMISRQIYRVLVDDSVLPKLDIGERLGSGPIGISIGIRYRVPTP